MGNNLMFDLPNSPWLTKSPLQIESEKELERAEKEEQTKYHLALLEMSIPFAKQCPYTKYKY